MDLITKVMTLILGSSIALAGPNPAPNQAPAEVSGDVAEQARNFTALMDDPIAYTHFHDLQGRFLATKGEYALYSLFTSDPLVSDAFDHIRRAQIQSILNGSFLAKLQSIQLSDWTRDFEGDQIYEILYQSIVELAQGLGFKKSTIDNLEFYIAPGASNAFTVSGSDEKIVVVVQTGLLKELKVGQIKAVVAHELKHIKRHHLVLEQMTKIMLTVLHSVLEEGLEVPLPKTKEETEQRSLKLQSFYRPLASKYVVTDVNQRAFMRQLGMAASAGADDAKAAQAETTNVVAYLMEFEKRMRSNPDQLIQLLANFSSAIAVMVKEVGSSPATVAHFEKIAARLTQDPSFLYDKDLKFRDEHYEAYAKQVLGALSQSVETTADRGAASQVPNVNLAAGLAGVMGLPFQSEHVIKLLKQISKQGGDILSKVTPETLSDFLAHAGDHPYMILRIHNIMENMPAYPFTFFANRFTKVVLLHQSILQEAIVLDARIKHLPLHEIGSLPKSEEKSKQVRATLDRVWNMIVKSLNAPAVSGDVNPRFRSLAEYILVEREILMDQEVTINKIEQSLAQINDPRVTRGFHALKADFNLAKLILSKLINKATDFVNSQSGPSDQERQKRLGILLKARTLSDINEIRDLRMSLKPAVQDFAKKRYGRLGADVASTVHNSRIPLARGTVESERAPVEEEEENAGPAAKRHQILHLSDSGCAQHFLEPQN